MGIEPGPAATILPWEPSGLLFWLLLAGHLLGDFLAPPDRAHGAPAERRGPFAHGALVLLLQLVAVAPVLHPALAAAVVAIAILHVIVDLLTERVRHGEPIRLRAFVLDQAAHLVVLFTAAALVSRLAPVSPHVSPEALGVWATIAVFAGVLAFTWNGGSALVSATLLELKPGLEEEEDRGEPDDDGVPGSGRLIGILERSIALILILLGQWAAIVLLLAAKSIARFEALKNRRFAEYYLAGTLTSVLVAIVAGLLLNVFLRGT